MPIELGVWRIDKSLTPLPHQAMDNERRLEDLLERDIGIIAPHLMVIGRQVPTSYGKLVDLLAIDATGNLTVIELKRDQTPRDVVAQVLDYGAWVHELEAEDVSQVWQRYIQQHRPDLKDSTFDRAFRERFHVKEMPEELNDSHELLIVASALDESTERIVNYLAEYHGVAINALFFRLFRDGDREYLTRVWLRDPSAPTGEASPESKGTWNGEYYVSCGGDRDWSEAVQYGFIAGGGGAWYSNTLLLLSPGDRIWVNVPGTGYVGVGRVTAGRVPIEEFNVQVNGREVPITSLPLKLAQRAKRGGDDGEFLVRVNWIKTVPEAEAVKEVGFFGNQNTVARPKSPKWNNTVQRLKQRFGVAD